MNNNTTLQKQAQANSQNLPTNPSLRGSENNSQASFDIREHLDQLEEDGGSAPKNEHSYHCPVCQAPNFKVNLNTGRYGSYSCDCATSEEGKKAIRDTVSPPQYQATG